MKIAEALLGDGFTEYQQPEPGCTLLSKPVKSPTSEVTDYTIHATLWVREGRSSVEFQVHFYLAKGNGFGISDSGFIVTFVPRDCAMVEDAKSFFERVFKMLHCVPDIHNND